MKLHLLDGYFHCLIAVLEARQLRYLAPRLPKHLAQHYLGLVSRNLCQLSLWAFTVGMGPE